MLCGVRVQRLKCPFSLRMYYLSIMLDQYIFAVVLLCPLCTCIIVAHKYMLLEATNLKLIYVFNIFYITSQAVIGAS